ncbi:MAG: adenylyl-sulfate kinase [Nitriliruptoraceae bacterium]
MTVPEPRAANLTPVDSHLTANDRRVLLGHGAATVWLTGLSGSGKSTIATALERHLVAGGTAAYLLDGDNIRHGLNRDLGFAPAERTENIRRVGEVCRLLCDAGLVAIAAFISPYAADRQLVRDLHTHPFVEVFVDTPLSECERRDVKGLYARARAGEIAEFSGVSAPYEPPQQPDVRIDTTTTSVDRAVAAIVSELASLGVLPPQ